MHDCIITENAARLCWDVYILLHCYKKNVYHNTPTYNGGEMG